MGLYGYYNGSSLSILGILLGLSLFFYGIFNGYRRIRNYVTPEIQAEEHDLPP